MAVINTWCTTDEMNKLIRLGVWKLNFYHGVDNVIQFVKENTLKGEYIVLRVFNPFLVVRILMLRRRPVILVDGKVIVL